MKKQEQIPDTLQEQKSAKNAEDSDLKVNERNNADGEPKTGLTNEADKGDETAGSVSVTE